jgi:hypothetical protein
VVRGGLDAEYLRRMEDVLAVYEKPYRADEPVVRLDEKPVGLHVDGRSPLPMLPGESHPEPTRHVIYDA